MSWPEATRLFILFVTILVVVYDITAIYFGGREASVSYVLYYLVREHPIIGVLLGVLIGHVFWHL